MKASDHMLKPSKSTLHQRGHPHMKHAASRRSSKFMGPDSSTLNREPAKFTRPRSLRRALLFGRPRCGIFQFQGEVEVRTRVPNLARDMTSADGCVIPHPEVSTAVPHRPRPAIVGGPSPSNDTASRNE